MRRAKLGDVYIVKVPNGNKIIQWAYKIEKYGTFIRVFDGLFDAIPKNIAEIIGGPHSYITSLHVSRAYRIGLLEWIGNYPVPDIYPTPEYDIEFSRDKDKHIYSIVINKTPIAKGLPRYLRFPVSSVDELPDEYRHVTLLHSHISIDWLLYLFDNGFSLQNPDVFYPSIYWGSNWNVQYQVYIDIVERAMESEGIV